MKRGTVNVPPKFRGPSNVATALKRASAEVTGFRGPNVTFRFCLIETFLTVTRRIRVWTSRRRDSDRGET